MKCQELKIGEIRLMIVRRLHVSLSSQTMGRGLCEGETAAKPERQTHSIIGDAKKR